VNSAVAFAVSEKFNPMPKTPLVSILAMLAASVLGAAGQYLYKAAADRGSGMLHVLMTPFFLAGMACYVGVMLLFTAAFRAGGTVTLLYPIYASTFIWAAVMGMAFYGQPIRLVHVIGMVLLVGGMYLMGVGNAALPK
jgi:multidrug transporter EmrE-like cation transporter